MKLYESGCMTMSNAREAFRDTPEIEVKSALPDWICLCIPPKLELKAKVVGYFRTVLSDLDPELCDRLCTGLDELLGNALEHGCRVRLNNCELILLRTSRLICFQIRDAGPGFDLNGLDHAAINNPPDDPLRHSEARAKMGLRPGGFGILLVKQIADDLLYNEQGNEVAFIKYL